MVYKNIFCGLLSLISVQLFSSQSCDMSAQEIARIKKDANGEVTSHMVDPFRTYDDAYEVVCSDQVPECKSLCISYVDDVFDQEGAVVLQNGMRTFYGTMAVVAMWCFGRCVKRCFRRFHKKEKQVVGTYHTFED